VSTFDHSVFHLGSGAIAFRPAGSLAKLTISSSLIESSGMGLYAMAAGSTGIKSELHSVGNSFAGTHVGPITGTFPEIKVANAKSTFTGNSIDLPRAIGGGVTNKAVAMVEGFCSAAAGAGPEVSGNHFTTDTTQPSLALRVAYAGSTVSADSLGTGGYLQPLTAPGGSFDPSTGLYNQPIASCPNN
jgi:hypothetical protein